MTRRNFIALVSLCVLVMLGAIVVGVGMYATQSARGQDALRSDESSVVIDACVVVAFGIADAL